MIILMEYLTNYYCLTLEAGLQRIIQDCLKQPMSSTSVATLKKSKQTHKQSINEGHPGTHNKYHLGLRCCVRQGVSAFTMLPFKFLDLDLLYSGMVY